MKSVCMHQFLFISIVKIIQLKTMLFKSEHRYQIIEHKKYLEVEKYHGFTGKYQWYLYLPYSLIKRSK